MNEESSRSNCSEAECFLRSVCDGMNMSAWGVKSKTL